MTASTSAELLSFRCVLDEWQGWLDHAAERRESTAFLQGRFSSFLSATYRDGKLFQQLERTRLNGYWRPAAERLALSSGKAILAGKPRPRSSANSLSAEEAELVCAYGERAARSWQALCRLAGHLEAATDPRKHVSIIDLVTAWHDLGLVQRAGPRSRLSPLAAQR